MSKNVREPMRNPGETFATQASTALVEFGTKSAK